MTPEGKVKEKAKKILKGMGAYYFMPVGGAYGRAGIPDIVGCLDGHFFALECKAGKGVPTALQQRELLLINDSKGIGFVINENNVDALESILKLALSVRRSNHT